MFNLISTQALISFIINLINDSNDAITRGGSMKPLTNLKDLHLVITNDVTIEKPHCEDTDNFATTPTMLETKGIYNIAKSTIDYKLVSGEGEYCYKEGDVVVTKLPTYAPVTVNVSLTDKDYETRTMLDLKRADVDAGGYYLPSTEKLDKLEKYARKCLKASEFGANDDTMVRGRMYCASIGHSNGKTYRQNLGLEFYLDVEDMDETKLIEAVKEKLQSYGLKASDNLHIILAGNAMRRFTNSRCFEGDEWNDKLEIINHSLSLYAQLPIITTKEDDLFHIVDRDFNAGIQTGQSFDSSPRMARGLWEDHRTLTSEVESRTKLEATRHDISEKQQNLIDNSPVAIAKEVREACKLEIDQCTTRLEAQAIIDGSVPRIFALLKERLDMFVKLEKSFYVKHYRELNQYVSSKFLKADYDAIMSIIDSLPTTDTKAKAGVIRSGATDITADQVKNAFNYIYSCDAERFEGPMYGALKSLTISKDGKKAA